MNCPYCKTGLKLDGEPYHSEIELYTSSEVLGSVTITFTCAECGEELGEYDFELELTITDFSKDHIDELEHELSVELTNESYDEYTNKIDGSIHPGVYATVEVSCVCGAHVEYQWTDYQSPAFIAKALDI